MAKSRMPPTTMWGDIKSADVVITLDRNDGIKVIKNRFGDNGEIELPALLKLILPFQKEYLQPLIISWINKLKLYNLFS